MLHFQAALGHIAHGQLHVHICDCMDRRQYMHVQESLGFMPSEAAVEMVADSARAQKAQQVSWRSSRRRFNLLLRYLPTLPSGPVGMPARLIAFFTGLPCSALDLHQEAISALLQMARN